jgi:16S rRNA (adenine1518-N6/adenine1519-N6)-dimethyltransferase
MDNEQPILDAREVLRRYGLQAKKSWGQNFLIDERAYEAIVNACGLSSTDLALEIGAGLGTLTSRLLRTGATVIAIERERDMCDVLRRELGDRPGFSLREEDAMQTDYAALAVGRDTVVVGNLPYQIAAPLLFRFLEARASVRKIVVMLQREVAARLLARPDTEDYSALTAQVHMLATVRRVCHVGRGGFLPAPRVDSTVVQLVPLATTAAPVLDLGRYSQVVRAAFGQRRKTLRNALAAMNDGAAMAAMAQTGIDLGRRGETLTVHEFARLADAITLASGAGSNLGHET